MHHTPAHPQPTPKPTHTHPHAPAPTHAATPTLLFFSFQCFQKFKKFKKLPSSQTSRCRCWVAHVLRFQDGKVRQDHVDGIVSEVVVGIGHEMTVKEQQGKVNHEKGESQMGRNDTCAMNLFKHLSHARMWHAWRCADVRNQTAQQKKCACDRWVCLHLTPYTLQLLLRVYETQKKCREKISVEKKKTTFITPSWLFFFNSSSGLGECMYRTPEKFWDFIVPCPSWSFLLVFVPSVGFSSIIVSGGFSVSRGMRLWETDLPNLLIFDDALVWALSICVRSI